MLEVKIADDGSVNKLAAGGRVDNVAIGLAAAVAMVHASLYSSSPAAAEQFRDVFRIALKEDSFIWNAEKVREHIQNLLCVVRELDEGGNDNGTESDSGV